MGTSGLGVWEGFLISTGSLESVPSSARTDCDFSKLVGLVCVWAHTYLSMPVEVRRLSLLTLESQGSNSGCQVWRQVILSALSYACLCAC